MMATEFLNIGRLAENEKAAASHATDFVVPLYNVWKQQEKTSGSGHFGNSEVQRLSFVAHSLADGGFFAGIPWPADTQQVLADRL